MRRIPRGRRDVKRNVLATVSDTGTAFAGPWGVSFAANLTADKETGIEEWSETMFIHMARTGKHQGEPNGRDILPPMPWFNMKDLSDADLKAIWRTCEAFRRSRIRCRSRSCRRLQQTPGQGLNCQRGIRAMIEQMSAIFSGES